MITINPENPTSDDHVEFTFNLGCPYFETTKTVVDKQFILNANATEPITPCVAAAPPYPFTWSVGRIQAGEYQVILNYPYGEEESQAFSVSEGLLPFPEPAIPTIGFVGAVILAIGLVWIANKAFKCVPPASWLHRT